jgi:hypothetical protein
VAYEGRALTEETKLRLGIQQGDSEAHDAHGAHGGDGAAGKAGEAGTRGGASGREAKAKAVDDSYNKPRARAGTERKHKANKGPRPTGTEDTPETIAWAVDKGKAL